MENDKVEMMKDSWGQGYTLSNPSDPCNPWMHIKKIEIFDKKISNDIVVIEFWAEWNNKNKFEDLDILSKCQTYRVDVNENESLKDKYDISSLPTLIVFNDGKEYKRFKANIMFELDATKKDIQKIIDDLILQKFR